MRLTIFISCQNFLSLFCWLKMAKHLSGKMPLSASVPEAANDLKAPSMGCLRGNLLIGCNHLLLLGDKVQLHRFHYNTQCWGAKIIATLPHCW